MQNLPVFPQFRKFTYEDREWYDEYYRLFPPYADFSFGNLMVWLNQYDDLEFSAIGRTLIFKCTILFMESEKVITLLGKENIPNALDMIFKWQKSQGLKTIISGVPPIIVDCLGDRKSRYAVTCDRDNYEYLYTSEVWATLDGPLMRKMRREITTFTKEYGRCSEVKEIDLHDRLQCVKLLACLHDWKSVYSNNDEDKQEDKVLTTLLTHTQLLPYKGIGLYMNDKLEGFLLYQELPQLTTVCFSHIKVTYNYRYMFDYLLHAAASAARKHGVTQINFEQDLGIAGLRTHKESLKPAGFFEKYTIEPAAG